jgi:hypothetical protein
VLAFFDHARKRFAQYPDAKRPVSTERYMRFPSQKLDNIADSGTVSVIPPRHTMGQFCRAQPPLPAGTLEARVFGRAFGPDGKPQPDITRQEHYIEDRFHIPVEVQARLAAALTTVKTKRFLLPEEMARLLVSHAYLGQLDVNPLMGEEAARHQWQFWATPKQDDTGTTRLRIEGTSDVASASGAVQGSDGRVWQHEVKLTWDGVIEMNGIRIRRLLMTAKGSEKLAWKNRATEMQGASDVARLPAGRTIEMSSAVRYGILGEPLATRQ